MIIADLHIHSPFSRATSKSGLLPNLYAWAKVKGIDVVGTGDFTHPAWQAHLREHLQPAEPGLFKLKDENVPPALPGVIPHARTVRFMLTAEISSIYKQGGQVRKIHNLLFAPDFDSATRISAALAAIGNIEADGRPILGLSARNLLEIVLEKAPDAYLVPAHIWTPWFSLFGSKSGFDTLEDCFADLSPQVFALETGLSSDPEMNRLISALDRYTLISNSDSHSPSKLGREANLFDTPLDFYAMRAALAQPAQGFHGTLEFFPEEGKYHLDGHRHCGVVLEPGETQRLGGVCPRCGKPLTVGVLHRVMELADRDAPHFPAHAPVVHSLVPLPEVLGELLGCGPDTQKAQTAYADIIQRFGAEFEVLLHASLEEIRTTHSAALAEAMARIRSGRVIRQGGYDGEYGTIQVFAPGEKEEYLGQGGLFATLVSTRARRGARNTLDKTVTTPAPVEVAPPQSSGPNAAQWAAITHCGGHALVAAGPGTGKTYTLAARMAWLVEQGRADPARMAAITFTRRAAEELRERLCVAAGEAAEQIFTGTFHAFALHWLRQLQPDLAVVDETAREWLLQRAFAHWRPREIQLVSQAIAAEYQGGQDAEPEGALPMTMAQLSAAYQEILAQHHAVDIEGIIPALLAQVESNAELAARLRAAVAWLFVDEFQDVNAEQYRLVYLLAHGAEVFAIGDPDQAIYGFRGADWRYFGQFGTQFHATAFTLTHNYRNQATILAAAHAVMAEENPARASLLANRPAQARILWQQLDSAEQEAEWIGTEVEKWVGGTSHRALHSNEKNYGFQEIAVLYRLSAQAGMLHRALAQRGIPVQHVGVTPFFQAAPLRPVRWLTQAAQDPGAQAWIALAACIPGIGTATQRRLAQAAPLQFHDFMGDVVRPAGLATTLTQRLVALTEWVQRFGEQAARIGVTEALEQAITSLQLPLDAADRQRLLQLAGAFGRDLSAFASYVNAPSTAYDPRAEAVTLLSLHAAKGLEFPVVFIAGVESGLLPWQGGATDEERRLFYVGLTRARDMLCLTAARQRTLFGQTQRHALSPFLLAIPETLRVQGGDKPPPLRIPKHPPSVPQLLLF